MRIAAMLMAVLVGLGTAGGAAARTAHRGRRRTWVQVGWVRGRCAGPGGAGRARGQYIPVCSRAASDIISEFQGGSKVNSTATSDTLGTLRTFSRTSSQGK